MLLRSVVLVRVKRWSGLECFVVAISALKRLSGPFDTSFRMGMEYFCLFFVVICIETPGDGSDFSICECFAIYTNQTRPGRNSHRNRL